MALMAVLVVFTLRLYTGRWRQLLDHFPFFSSYRKLVAARTMEVMGLMLSNGLSLRDVLRLCQESATPYLRWHLLHMEQRLSSGQESVALVLQTGLLQSHELARLRVIAQGDGFAAAMCRLGQRAHARCQQAMVRSARLASGVLLVSAAGFAALMVLAVYSVGSFVGT
jgi:type II secretory pathway component PulF